MSFSRETCNNTMFGQVSGCVDPELAHAHAASEEGKKKEGEKGKVLSEKRRGEIQCRG